MSDAETEPKADVQAELARLRAQGDEYLDLARRAKAEFINYQDRVRRDKVEWTRQAVEGFVQDFLAAMDGFHLARFDDPRFMEAVKLVEKEFLRVLAKSGVTPMEAAGKAFDPLYHEAVTVEETEGVPDGTVLEEVRRGWLSQGRVLRPASVRIAKAPPAQKD